MKARYDNKEDSKKNKTPFCKHHRAFSRVLITTSSSAQTSFSKLINNTKRFTPARRDWWRPSSVCQALKLEFIGFMDHE